MICEHPKESQTLIWRKYRPDGGRSYYLQCLVCGKCSNAIKKANIPLADKNEAIEYDPTIWDRYLENEMAKKTAIRDEEKARWQEQYNEYLQSEQWRELRTKILQRDKGICQGCLDNLATDVHHLTYEHVFDELLFELTSLCRLCHSKAHDKDEL